MERTAGASIASNLDWARLELAVVSESPVLEAQVLLAEVLERPRTWIVAHPEFDLDPANQNRFQDHVNRVRSGEALPYVVGFREFYGRRFRVSPEVLIPRPETELLIEAALARYSAARAGAVIDVGTGSGCVAITLALELPRRAVLASDVSHSALQVGAENARMHGVQDQIGFVQADTFLPFSGPFQLVCANLPYIDTQSLQGLAVADREPALALDGGNKGTDLILRTIQQLPDRLMAGGWAIFEIDPSQRTQLIEAARALMPDCEIELRKDYSDRDRIFSVRIANE